MSYYFYDLETSGLDPKYQRIMQFAGQRTDDDFNPIGEPDNWLVKLTPEVLPDPEAILVTKITPQKTLEEGYNEPDFIRNLYAKVFTPGTTVMGFNSIRFDDEFMRYTLYRNFYDPYEREWSDNRSRWDIVDLVRMTRALRPEGIVWPINDKGMPTNRLELLTKSNNLVHEAAHDALSDVLATIAVARLIREKQPKLFAHLLSLKDKKAVANFIEENKNQPIVHSSSKFSSDNLSTSVVAVLGPHPVNKNAVFVFDLRYSPNDFATLNASQLQELAFTTYKELESAGKKRLPVKLIHLNKSPALAPIGVLDEASQQRINLTLPKIKTHLKELQAIDGFHQRVSAAWEGNEYDSQADVDARLYDGFLNDKDKRLLQAVVTRDPVGLADWDPGFSDERLTELLLRYKGRYYPDYLSDRERQIWEQYRLRRLSGKLQPVGLDAYLRKLEKLKSETTDKEIQFILGELQLYAESIAPYDNQELFADD